MVSLVAYWFAARKENGPEEEPWKHLGRVSYRVHSLALLGIIGTLFFMLFNEYFEYHYVWKHSNKRLPVRYLFSCFWEGQEGSFLLWGFWHVLLGNILIRTARHWENRVMAVFSITQAFITSMLLGIYVFGHKIGSDPFILIRELPENLGLPWTQDPNYLQKFNQLQDGKGLNPLLQNYWMTIHPPTLFLGFAATLVPFAYACAGLWKRNLSGWIKPALPWTFFGVAILGGGVLMGGAWAYEALSFGGFWAWDPVENASLVPWLTLVGAGHVMLINRKKGRSTFTALFLTLISFILVLYSTFLTRSGILGDSSVHSFTSDGMLGQLLVYLLFFLGLSTTLLLRSFGERLFYGGLSVTLLVAGVLSGVATEMLVAFLLFTGVMMAVAYNRYFSKEQEEEERLWSREFWVFIGSLVLLLSAVQITFSTSTPVFNKLLAPFTGFFTFLHESTGWAFFSKLSQADLAPPSDVIDHYNSWQVPLAFIVCLLIGAGQFFRYKHTNMKAFLRKISFSALVALLLSIVLVLSLDITVSRPTTGILALLFTSLFATLANLDYFLRLLKGKFDKGGASIAHLGFGLIMLGALISQYKSKVISQNTSLVDVQQLSNDFNNNKDILLFKGDTVRMGDFFITYKGKEKKEVDIHYRIGYFGTRPKQYEQGDLVMQKGMIFQATKDHVAGSSFLADSKHWERITKPNPSDMDRIRPWDNKAPGEKQFELAPRVQLNPQFGNVPEPDTRHYWNKDIYTHIRYAELEPEDTTEDGYLPAEEHKVQVGDTISAANALVVLDSLQGVRNKQKHQLLENDIAAKAVLKIHHRNGKTYRATPLYIIRDSSLFVPDVARVDEIGLKFRIERIDPAREELTVSMAQHKNNKREFIVMQAILFPGINILWTGCVLMVLGTVLAIRFRVKQ